jgi:hypothetical protein
MVQPEEGTAGGNIDLRGHLAVGVDDRLRDGLPACGIFQVVVSFQNESGRGVRLGDCQSAAARHGRDG